MSRSLKLLAKELDVPVVARLPAQPRSRAAHGQAAHALRPARVRLPDRGHPLLRADTGRRSPPGAARSRPRDITVWSLDEQRAWSPAPITDVFPSGVKEVYRVALASGREVKATGNHPFVTLQRLAALDELTVGDRIAIPRHIPEPIGVGLGWTEDRLGLLAHLIGDGCVLHGNSPFTTPRTTKPTSTSWRGRSRRVRYHAPAGGAGDVVALLPARPLPVHAQAPNPLHGWFRELGYRRPAVLPEAHPRRPLLCEQPRDRLVPAASVGD